MFSLDFLRGMSASSGLNYSQAGLRSRKESEVFGWSRIPNNTGNRRRIFRPTPDVQLDHFYIALLNWEFLWKWYNFF